MNQSKIMQIIFWGVRGSIPCPGPHTVKYGGNTACLELSFEGLERSIIIDAGSGIRELGNLLVARELPRGPIKAEIFLTHTHWDHIMGFPFFSPIYIPGTNIKVYGPVTYESDSLEGIVGGQLTYRYFPVRQTELASKIEYINLREGSFELSDGIKVTTKYLNHPILCLGYRFEYQDRSLCTAYDTEPFQNLFCTDPHNPAYDEAMALEGAQVAREENQKLEDFFKGADCLVYDTQYTQKEYESNKKGWGHSPMEYAISAARRAGVKRLVFFHHEPLRTDAHLDELAQKLFQPPIIGDMEVFFAKEGCKLEI
jgi:phosphoribosyl 1,2-cyclic phosphodiesterase